MPRPSRDDPTVPEAAAGDLIELRILTMTDEEFESYLVRRADAEVVRVNADGTVEILAEDLKALDEELRRKYGVPSGG